jgi:hypothetical protein
LGKSNSQFLRLCGRAESSLGLYHGNLGVVRGEDDDVGKLFFIFCDYLITIKRERKKLLNFLKILMSK